MDDYVLVEFKFSAESAAPGIRSPVDPLGERAFGWVPGGQTKGGAREWLIDPNAPNNGVIDLNSVKIRELPA